MAKRFRAQDGCPAGLGLSKDDPSQDRGTLKLRTEPAGGEAYAVRPACTQSLRVPAVGEDPKAMAANGRPNTAECLVCWGILGLNRVPCSRESQACLLSCLTRVLDSHCCCWRPGREIQCTLGGRERVPGQPHRREAVRFAVP